MPDGSAWGVPGVLSFRIVHRRLTIIYDVIKAWCPGQFLTPPAEPSCPGPCSSANSKDLQQFTYSTIISAPLSRNPKISFLVLLSRSCFLVSCVFCGLSQLSVAFQSALSPWYVVWPSTVSKLQNRVSPCLGIPVCISNRSKRRKQPWGALVLSRGGVIANPNCLRLFMWKSNIQLQSVALNTRVPSLFPGVIVWMLKWSQQTTRWCTCYHFTCVWRQNWRKGILTEQFIIIEYMIRHHQLDFIENMIIWVHA